MSPADPIAFRSFRTDFGETVWFEWNLEGGHAEMKHKATNGRHTNRMYLSLSAAREMRDRLTAMLSELGEKTVNQQGKTT